MSDNVKDLGNPSDRASAATSPCAGEAKGYAGEAEAATGATWAVKALVWVQAVLSLLVIVRVLNGLDPWGVILTYWGVNALKNVLEGLKDGEDLQYL